MDERLLPAQRRFVTECGACGVLAVLWLACLVLGVDGAQTTQAISNFGLIAAALLSLPFAAQRLAGRLRQVLDGLMIAASLLLVSWVLVLSPLFRSGGDNLMSQAISLAYPIGDVVARASGGQPVLPLAPPGHLGPGLGRAAGRHDARGELDWLLHVVDGSVVRAHQHAAGARRRPATADLDTGGLVDPDQPGDQDREALMLRKLMEAGAVKRTRRGRPRIRPAAVAGDKGYSHLSLRRYLRRRGTRAVIPPKSDQPRQPSFDKAAYRQQPRGAYGQPARGLASDGDPV